jgi:DNA-binding transcriptional MerR regulator
MIKNGELITTRDVASILNVSVATVNKWAARGLLEPALKLPCDTGTHLFDREQVEQVRLQRVQS